MYSIKNRHVGNLFNDLKSRRLVFMPNTNFIFVIDLPLDDVSQLRQFSSFLLESAKISEIQQITSDDSFQVLF